jgi:putative transcriptional regulator
MIHHHPDDDLLMSHAAGRLSSGHALLLDCHVHGCAECQARLRTLESIGGAMLEQLPPAALRAQSLAETMAALDAPVPARPAPTAAKPVRHPAMPPGVAWPRALRGCSATAWRWLGPGMRWSRVTVPYDTGANVFLLRIGAGKNLPLHTHSQSELTQILHGAFHDGRALFGPGDFDAAGGEILHQPKVLAQSECICLASVEGRVLFQGTVARVLGSLVGM